MTDYAGLLAARPQTLRDEAEAWRRTVAVLRDQVWPIRDVPTRLRGAWAGDGADAAGRYLGGLAERVEGSGNRMHVVPQILDDTADRLADLQRRLQGAVDTATRAGVTVTGDGTLLLLPAGDAPATELQVGALQTAERDLGALVAEAGRLDADAIAALRAAVPPPGEVDYARAQLIPPPVVPSGMTPQQTRQWWASLSDEARESLTVRDPRLVGNLDGIPAVDRDRANRLTLAAARTDDLAQRDRLAPDDEDGRTALTNRLAALDAIDQRIHPPPGGPAPTPAMLLGFDPYVDEVGRAIIAVGDPDHARNVATIVPGAGTDLDDHFAGDIRRADNLWAEANDPRRRGQPTATITWLGYAPPSGVVSGALSHSAAEVGGVTLAHFQDGLRATHDGPPSHNTVIGHSYGTTTIGEAAAQPGGLHADDIVLVGSPGMHQSRATDLGLPDGHVFATRSDDDTTINWADVVAQRYPLTSPYHDGALVQGVDPTSSDFGATVFPSDPGTDHSSYFDAGTGSIRSTANVVTGTGG